MTRPSNYLCGRPANRTDSPYDAAWRNEQAKHHDAAWENEQAIKRLPRKPTLMERNSGRLIILSFVALVAIGFASLIASRWV